MDTSPPGSSVHEGFSREEYLLELPFPPPGDLPISGAEPRSPTLQVDSLLSELPGKPKYFFLSSFIEIHLVYISTV